MCKALNAGGSPCRSVLAHVGERCWTHASAQERKEAGYAPELKPDPDAPPRPRREARAPDSEPPLRLLPRLPSVAEVIEGLRGWAEEFDGLDPDRYTAAEFVGWLELEHQPRKSPVKVARAQARSHEPVYRLVGAGRAALAAR